MPLRLRDPYFYYFYRYRLHTLRTSLGLSLTYPIIDRIESMDGLRNEQHYQARALGTLAFQTRPASRSMTRRVTRPAALRRSSHIGAWARRPHPVQPRVYLWLNRELARLEKELSLHLIGLRRLPSRRLRRRANHHTLISDARRLANGIGKPDSFDNEPHGSPEKGRDRDDRK